MHRGGDAAPEDRCRNRDRGAGIAEDRCGKRCAGRDADEAVNGIPDAVQPRQLVREELHACHEAARPKHERMLQDAQVSRKLDPP